MNASSLHVGASRDSDRRAASKQAIVVAAKDNSPVTCVRLVLNRSSMLQLMAYI